MRILITSHTLRILGEPERWALTVCRELQARGHEVSIFTFLAGNIASSFDCPVYVEVPDGPFDLALVSHYTCLSYLDKLDCPKVFTSHDPLSAIERAEKGADHYVSTSEEVRAFVAQCGFKSTIIRPPVDVEAFRPQPGERSADVLAACGSLVGCQVAVRACEEAGLSCEVYHPLLTPDLDLRDVLSRCNMAVATGQVALSALACGVQVLAFDVQGGRPMADGWVTEENIPLLAQHNLTGRYAELPWKVQDVAEALNDYDEPAVWGPFHVRKYHDVSSVVDRYFDLAGIEVDVLPRLKAGDSGGSP